MAALGTQVEIALVLWEVFLFFLTTLEPKHERPARQIVKTIVVLHEILAFNLVLLFVAVRGKEGGGGGLFENLSGSYRF